MKAVYEAAQVVLPRGLTYGRSGTVLQHHVDGHQCDMWCLLTVDIRPWFLTGRRGLQKYPPRNLEAAVRVESRKVRLFGVDLNR
jgi:hypothetical protein